MINQGIYNDISDEATCWDLGTVGKKEWSLWSSNIAKLHSPENTFLENKTTKNAIATDLLNGWGVAWTVPSWSGLELSQRCKGQSANDAANRVDSCVFKVQDQVQFFSIFCGLHYSSRSWITCNSHPQKSSIFLCLSQRDHPPPWLSCRQVLWSFPAWVCRLCLSEGWSIEPQMRWHKWPVESTNPFSSSIIQPGKLCTNPISSCGDVTKFKDTPHHSTLFI